MRKAFTLIELLVVISIIALMSSVVLASLNGARNKSNDASIKANLVNIRPKAALMVDNGGVYGGGIGVDALYWNNCNVATSPSFFFDTEVKNMIEAARRSSSDTSVNGARCIANSNNGSDATAWAIAVKLKTNGGYGWCIDSTGVSRRVLWAGAVNPGSAAIQLTATCPTAV